MKLLAKFNLLLLMVFVVSVAITGYVSHDFLQRNAREVVLQQARLMMGAATGMRTYTSEQVGPKLAGLPDSTQFLPQRIPAYSATEVFNNLRKDYPAYTYKEATLNPTNLRDRAADWEADVVNTFRNDPTRKEFIGERETPEGSSLFLARPLAAKTPCLTCHSTPNMAPPGMLATYGNDHGFGWNKDEIIAAQIVSVPTAVPMAIADRAFRSLLISLGGVFLLTIALLDLGLVFIVVRPVRRLSGMADEISKGNMDVGELPVHGKDEINHLAQSFNRMYLSLVKAMKMLEE